MIGVPNAPDPNRSCPKCDFPAELGHTHCCHRCHDTGGRFHGRNCTGNACPLRAPPSSTTRQTPYSTVYRPLSRWTRTSLPEHSTTRQMPYSTVYRPWSRWTRKSGEDLRQFIHWFVPDGPDFPNKKWQILEWTFSNVDRTRPVILVPLSAHQHFSGAVIDVCSIDARGNYDMKSVTGVAYEVICQVCRSVHITSVLRDVVEHIETFKLLVLGIRCEHATHRSVAIINAVLMLAYPDGSCMPFTRRVQNAMKFWWRERQVSTEEYIRLTELMVEAEWELHCRPRKAF